MRSSNSDEKRFNFPWVLAALIVYLLPMAAVFVDEIVLRTFWFAGQSPQWVKRCLETIYPFWKGLG